MRFPAHIEDVIAEFRGLPRPTDRSRERDTKPVDSLMEVLIERYSIGKVRPEQAIMENWAQIMGPKDAHRCSPERIDGRGRLVINVSNPILRRELLFRRHKILQSVREIEGCEEIVDIELRAG